MVYDLAFTVKYDDITNFYFASAGHINGWSEELGEIANDFKSFAEMESFQGLSADHIKAYVQEVHFSLLLSLSEILSEYNARYLLYKDGFYNEVDDNLHSHITEETLTDLERFYKQSHLDFWDQADIAASAAGNIQDLVQGLPDPVCAWILAIFRRIRKYNN